MVYLNQFAPNAGIVVACVVIGLALKWAFSKNEQGLAAIPWILAVSGGLLAFVGVLITPQDEGLWGYTAIAEGVVSGLAACGCYQVIHQQTKLREKEALEEAEQECKSSTDEPAYAKTFLEDFCKMTDGLSTVIESITKHDDSEDEPE